MGGLYADRVMETTSTTGTNPFALSGPVTGYQSFSSKFSNGQSVRYMIQGGTEWEIGEGTYLSNVIYRDGRVHDSSNAGGFVSFSSGVKAIWCEVPAEAVADMGTTLAFRALLVMQ